MAYQATLNGTQHLTIINRGQQTQINLTSSNFGQQQSQSSSFSTGVWAQAPELFATDRGFILKINGEKSSYFIAIAENSIQTIGGISQEQNATPVKLENLSNTEDRATVDFKPMQPMQPMQPMRMGNMSMDINSMSMQMGNMSLNLGNKTKTRSKVFCSQCGAEAKSGDRFCRSCGHNL